MPKPTAPTPPSATLAEEQRQSFNGTYRPPQINIPTVDPVATLSMKPITPDASPVVPSYSPARVNTSPEPQPTYQPSCDAACLQARSQENYQAEYAVGQLIGTVITRSIVGAVNLHRRNKFCKNHPNGSWNSGNGSWTTCASINGEHKVRVKTTSPEVRSQPRSAWTNDETYVWQNYKGLSTQDKTYVQAFCPESPNGAALVPQAKVKAGQGAEHAIGCSAWLSAKQKAK
jgi:hypothetical protein